MDKTADKTRDKKTAGTRQADKPTSDKKTSGQATRRLRRIQEDCGGQDKKRDKKTAVDKTSGKGTRRPGKGTRRPPDNMDTDDEDDWDETIAAANVVIANNMAMLSHMSWRLKKAKEQQRDHRTLPRKKRRKFRHSEALHCIRRLILHSC